MNSIIKCQMRKYSVQFYKFKKQQFAEFPSPPYMPTLYTDNKWAIIIPYYTSEQLL
jgi:hypothetical protein